MESRVTMMEALKTVSNVNFPWPRVYPLRNSIFHFSGPDLIFPTQTRLGRRSCLSQMSASEQRNFHSAGSSLLL